MTNPFNDPSRFIARPFETTCWSVVIRAGNFAEDEEKQDAIRYLCEKYWFPIYVFVRRKVNQEQDAQDLTQAFFSKLIAENVFSKADEARGKFRTFLLNSVQNFLINDWRKNQALKRGGDRQKFSIDFDSELDTIREKYFESREVTAQQQYERRWAIQLLKSALNLVEQDYQQQNREILFQELRPTLTGSEMTKTYSELADQLEMSESNIKVAARRLRDKFRQKLRLLVADTVSDPSEIDDEIRSLFNAFSG